MPVDLAIFDKFRPWEGIVPAGFFSNFLGTLTREANWTFPNEIRKIYSTERYERFPRPPIDDNIFDWIALLEAVVDARDQFVMLALGAGWGRWLVIGAAAVRQRHGTMPYRLVGVEAEPTHFRWMQEHFADNAIDPAEHNLIEAAASDKSGYGWFYVGRPDAWYGQSIIKDETLDHFDIERDEIEYNGERAKSVRMVDLAEITLAYKRIDYVHLDIQGAELGVLGKCPEILDTKVKRVLVGTHSTEIETSLRKLFQEHGWVCQYDYPMGSSIKVEDTVVVLGDGVQVWINQQVTKARLPSHQRSYLLDHHGS